MSELKVTLGHDRLPETGGVLTLAKAAGKRRDGSISRNRHR